MEAGINAQSTWDLYERCLETPVQACSNRGCRNDGNWKLTLVLDDSRGERQIPGPARGGTLKCFGRMPPNATANGGRFQIQRTRMYTASTCRSSLSLWGRWCRPITSHIWILSKWLNCNSPSFSFLTTYQVSVLSVAYVLLNTSSKGCPIRVLGVTSRTWWLTNLTAWVSGVKCRKV